MGLVVQTFVYIMSDIIDCHTCVYRSHAWDLEGEGTFLIFFLLIPDPSVLIGVVGHYYQYRINSKTEKVHTG